ncbi:MAG: 4-(cytidine 5'-diphospho)-2-C-methyl-D-erythritol kinase, partial [Bryobacteraceae bacterium]
MTRRVRVRAFGKINLDLRVLHRRADGYHEIRTVLQTISLADTIDIAFTRSRETAVSVESTIADTLMTRAAHAALEEMKLTARVEMKLRKAIPVGGGLGGGSSDAAAVLRALPALARRKIPPDRLHALAATIGSDVPFFLIGGTAAGFGRGELIYPLPDGPRRWVLVVAPGIEVSTAEAYRALDRGPEPRPVDARTHINDFE